MNELILAPFFSDPIELEEEEDMTEEIEEMSEEEKEMAEELKKKLDKEKQIAMEKLQAEALQKQKDRNEVMGELLRSKGFLWLATSNNLIGAWQQAGNVLRIRAEAQWLCLTPQLWEGESVEEMVRKVRVVVSFSSSKKTFVVKFNPRSQSVNLPNQLIFCLQDMQKENGEEWEYKDRRQEIVFIGHRMKRDVIQKILDECLLTDEEMALGPQMWKETMEEFDNINLELEEDEDDEEDEECEDEDCEDEKCDKKDDKENYEENVDDIERQNWVIV